ncbi:hypothetical protein Tco_1404699 [Tanacetum coccineum]
MEPSKAQSDNFVDRIKNIDGKIRNEGNSRYALGDGLLPGTYVEGKDGTLRPKPTADYPSMQASSFATFGGSLDGFKAFNVTHANPMNDSSSLSNTKDATEIFGASPSVVNATTTANGKTFASMLQSNPNKKTVKIQELRNPEKVEGAAVVLPMDAVDAMCSRFENTLYGYFIGKRLAFPLVENYVKNTWAKFGLKRIQLHENFFMFQFNTKEGMENVMENGPWLNSTDWVKLHHVPIVAYSEIGLSLITTQLGRPIMLDTYTSNMCLSSWGRNTYARALVEFSADEDLKKSIVIAIPRGNGKGHSLAEIEIEYEWLPPHCSSCKVFDHCNDKCPNNPKVVEKPKEMDDGFTTVSRKKSKAKQPQMKYVEGVRLTKPALNLQYRKVDKNETLKNHGKAKDNSSSGINKNTQNNIKTTNVKPSTTISNSFSALNVEEELGSTTILNDDSDGEEMDEEFVIDDRSKQPMTSTGASTPATMVIHENNLSVFAILESHVANSNLQKTCSLVFRHWDWVSNGVWCKKGTRIIIGWNHNDVDVVVITQDDQAVHIRIWLKKERKELFCSFIYAHNKYQDRRSLWSALNQHKCFIRDRPWCLLGDFNATLFLEESTASSSRIDIAMREFKECVNDIEVTDVQSTGLQFTWNQKPKGNDGILKKLDRIMVNMVFNSEFVGSHAIFKPYRNSDHSPSVLCIPSVTKEKPKPFKFCNIITKHERFEDTVRNMWGMEEAACVNNFNHALIEEERFLKQKAKVLWLKEGDSNSAYFHKTVKSRTSRSRIDVVSNGDGIVFANEEVPAAFIANHMVRNVTDREIKDAMFSMGDDKAPGPDGYSTAFFKDAWVIIGEEITLAIREFFINGKLLKEINHTIIALIPKSAFVPGRCISDNILLTQELMHNYHLDRGSPRCAFKVDIQKAYDTVDWGFLLTILKGLDSMRKGKRGLRQGDLLSPYLFTLVMEVLTLMLQRRVMVSNTFSYHRKGLDEFKIASGLIPSLPKSTAYFCNVLNHVKISILNVLPFEEGRLPVKYLGVPLVSSRLMVRDCKELVENVKNQIHDWRNKSLSMAGRLQLIRSVIGSMHVFWASVFIIPNGVLVDIKQCMRNFLWSPGASLKDQAKVAWDVVCLPKDEGGLGIRRLDHFNSALMVSHIWKLLSLKESLWVKWIHAYKLCGRNFWDIPLRGNMSWGWRKILQLRPIVREFIWHKVGNGSNTSLWYDRWCAASPLANHVSNRDVFRAGLSLSSCISDIVAGNVWNWPSDLIDKYPLLNSCKVPLSSEVDSLEWRLHDGAVKNFSISQVWSNIRPRDVKVPWYHMVWFPLSIPRHAFNMWLIVKRKLKTQDRINPWDVVSSLGITCSLCDDVPDSHEHLFFNCSYASAVWNHMKHRADLGHVLHDVYAIIDHFGDSAKRKSSRVVIAKLVVAASAYFIWQERNWRLFKGTKRSVQQVIDCIVSAVRLKLLTCRFKRSKDGSRYARLWDLPDSIFR